MATDARLLARQRTPRSSRCAPGPKRPSRSSRVVPAHAAPNGRVLRRLVLIAAPEWRPSRSSRAVPAHAAPNGRVLQQLRSIACWPPDGCGLPRAASPGIGCRGAHEHAASITPGPGRRPRRMRAATAAAHPRTPRSRAPPRLRQRQRPGLSDPQAHHGCSFRAVAARVARRRMGAATAADRRHRVAQPSVTAIPAALWTACQRCSRLRTMAINARSTDAQSRMIRRWVTRTTM